MNYNKSVFINCPFDKTYSGMLHSMIFTIVTMGYLPRISSELTDAGTVRLDKIIIVIKQSRISIHDLSKIKADESGEFYRMNMPFELGLDFGYRKYASQGDRLCDKKFLIIGNKDYEYMKALSDIFGIDIQYHNNKEKNLFKSIRHWFVTN